MVVKSKGIPPKCLENSGLGTMVICPDFRVLGEWAFWGLAKQCFFFFPKKGSWKMNMIFSVCKREIHRPKLHVFWGYPISMSVFCGGCY